MSSKQVIATESENKAALKRIEVLMNQNQHQGLEATVAANEELDSLVLAVERFEKSAYPIGEPTPEALLAFRCEQRGVSEKIVRIKYDNGTCYFKTYLQTKEEVIEAYRRANHAVKRRERGSKENICTLLEKEGLLHFEPYTDIRLMEDEDEIYTDPREV